MKMNCILSRPFRWLVVLLSISTVSLIRSEVGGPADPKLSIGEAPGGRVLVQWHAAAGTTQLYWAGALDNAATWQRIDGTTPLAGGYWQAEFLRIPPKAFFELRPSATPVAPPNVRLTLVGDHFRLEWDSTSDASGYVVYLGQSPATGPGNYLQRLTVPLANVLEITGLTAGQTYYITIAATNGAGEGLPATAVSGVFGPKVNFTGRAVHSYLLPSGATFEVLAEGTVLQLVRVGGGDGAGYEVTVDALGEFDLRDLPAGSYFVSYRVNGQWVPLPAPARVWNGLPLAGPLVLPSGPSPPPPATTLLGFVRLSTGQPARIFQPEFGLDARAQLMFQFADGSVRVVVPDSLGAWAVPEITGGFPVTITGSYQGLTTTTTVPAAPATLEPSNVQFPQIIPQHLRTTIQQNGQEVTRISPGVPATFQAEISNPDNLSTAPRWSVEYNGERQNATGLSFTHTFDIPGSTTTGTARLQFDASTYLFSMPGPMEFPVVPHSGTACWSGMTGIWDPAVPDEILPAHPATATITYAGAGSHVTATAAATVNPNGVTWFDTGVDAAGARPYVVRVDKPGHMRFLWPFEFELPNESTFCVVPVITGTHSQSSGNTLTVTHPSGASVQIPYGSLKLYPLAGGLTWTGDVVVEMAAWNPLVRTPLPPGAESRGPGYRKGIEPFSCVWCNVYSAIGLPLTSFGATLTLPAPPGHNAAAQPVHHQDEFTGYFQPWGDENGRAVQTAPNRFTTRLDESGLFVLASENDLMEPMFEADRSINYPFQLLVNRSIFPVTVTSPGRTNFGHLYLPQIIGADVEVLDLLQAPGLHYQDPQNALSGGPVPPMKKRVIARAFSTLDGPVAALPAVTPAKVPLTLATSEPKLKSHLNDTTIVAIESKTRFLNRTGSTPEDAKAYYEHIHAPSTLERWRERGGFPPRFGDPVPGAGLDTYASCYYYNLGDLGFARAQTMRVTISPRDNQPNVAFAVTNYRTLEDARCHRAPIATVCMDYSALSDGHENEARRYTRFYVYAGNDGKLLDCADLDNAGDAKCVPNLCVICHGGSKYKAGQSTDLGSRFLPFDLAAYSFHPAIGVQKQEVAAMNKAVLRTLPASHAIQDLIAGWYGQTDPLADPATYSTFRQDYVPSATGDLSWRDTPDHSLLYNNLFKHSCRVCHISRDQGKFQMSSFNDFAGESSSYTSSCTGLGMPNSQRTWGIFWGSRCSKNLNIPGAIDMPTVLGNHAGDPCPQLPPE